MSFPSIVPHDDAKQRLRVRRFLMAFGSYLGSLALMGFYAWQGFMQVDRYLTVLITILAVNGLVYVVLRSGLNRRFRDPSLTSPQILVATGLLMLTLYSVDEGRGALLLLYLATFIFGIFRLTTRQFLALQSAGLAGYAVVIGLLAANRPQALQLHLELVQWVALASVLPWFALVGGYISRLRHRLSESNQNLQQAFDQIRELALYDEVTGLHNRRFVMEMLAHEHSRIRRTNGSVVVALLDLDHFKQVNDNHGHTAGDQVLRRVAETLDASLRTVDGLGRYGGEEFLVVMPGADLEEGGTVAERLRSAVADCTFGDIAPDLRVTISIGLTEVAPDEPLDRAIDRADAALYRAKHGGRNRVNADDRKQRAPAASS